MGSCVFTLDLSNLALRKSKSTWDFELNFLNILLQAQLPSSNLFSLTKETFYSFKDFDCCCSLISHKPNHKCKHWMNDCNGSNVDKQAKTNLYPHFLLSFFSKRLKHKTLYYCIGTFEDLYLLNLIYKFTTSVRLSDTTVLRFNSPAEAARTVGRTDGQTDFVWENRPGQTASV